VSAMSSRELQHEVVHPPSVTVRAPEDRRIAVVVSDVGA
jgi:hypothetical protein